MSSRIERINRDTGGPIDVEELKRKSWNGFSAEYVRIPGPARYDFTVRGTWAHLFLFDLHRTDGETVVGNQAPPMSTKDLRNKMAFAPPGCPVDGWCALEKPGSITTVAISPDIRFDPGVKLDSLPALFGFEDDMLRASILQFQALLADPSADGSRYAEALVALVAFELARVSHSAIDVEHPAGTLGMQQVRTITTYIDGNLSRRPRVSKLAELVGMTRLHFIRSFKQAVGVPPHQYVIARRIQRARELLVESDLPIAGVAAETGFGTSIQLARAFRRAIGMSPSEYRRHSMLCRLVPTLTDQSTSPPTHPAAP